MSNPAYPAEGDVYAARHDMGTLVDASLYKNPKNPEEYILDLKFTTTYNGPRDLMHTVHECYLADRATCLRTLEAISRPLGAPSSDQVWALLRRIEELAEKRLPSS